MSIEATPTARGTRWRKIAFWTGLAVLSVVVLLLSWLWTADLSVFKPQIERLVVEQTRREFSIDGDFQIDLAGTSVVVAENVRLANADWAEEPQMVSLGRIELHVDLWSLIKGPIQVLMIDVDDAEIYLTGREDGDANWVLPIEAAPEPDVDDGEDFDPREIVFDQVEFDRVRLVYTDPARTAPLELDIARLRQSRRDDDFQVVALNATLNDKILKLDGEAGTWDAIVSGVNIHFDIQLVLDTLTITASGHLDDVVDLRKPTLDFTAAGPDIDDLTRVLGLGEEGSGDISLEGRLAATGDGPLELSIVGNVGLTDIKARGRFSDLQNFDTIDFNVLANGPDLGRLLQLAGIHNVREAPFMIDIDAIRDGNSFRVDRANMLFGEARFEGSANLPNFPSVDDASIDMRIFGPDIERFRYIFDLPGAATGAFSADFELDVTPEGLEVAALEATTSLGTLTANGSLGEAPSYVGTQVNFEVRSDSLANLASAHGVDALPNYPVSITGAIELLDGRVRTRQPVVVQVEDIGATVTAAGDLVLADGAVGSELALTAKGSDLAELIAAFVDAPSVPAEPYDIAAQMLIADNELRIRDATGILGTSTLEAEGLLIRAPGVAGSRLDFRLSGPTFEELTAGVEQLKVRPGAFELGGRLRFNADSIEFERIALDREYGDLLVDLELGLPATRRWANFAVRINGRDIGALLESFDQIEANPARYDIDLSGRLRGALVDIDKLDVSVGDAVIRANGELNLTENAADTRFAFSGEIPDLSTLGTVSGRAFQKQGLAWSGEVINENNRLHLDDFTVQLGGSDVFGDIIYELGEIPRLEVSVTSNSLIYEPLLEPVDAEDYEPQPEFDDGRLIPDVEIPFDRMANLNADIHVRIDRLERGTLHLRNLSFNALLHDGALTISDTGFNARAGRMDMRASLDPADGTGLAKLELVARDLALGFSELNKDLVSRSNLDINLKSTGNDLRTLLANANGIFFADVRGGRIGKVRFVQALYGDLLNEIIGTINPFAKSEPHTIFECIVLPVKITDGKVTSIPYSFVSTDKMRITSKSDINLATEQLNVNIRTSARKLLGISAGEFVNPYVKIIGTLAEPRIAVDEKGVLITGGAAVATGGLSILAKGVWDRVSKSKDPCSEVSAEGSKALAEFMPNLTTKPQADAGTMESMTQ